MGITEGWAHNYRQRKHKQKPAAIKKIRDIFKNIISNSRLNKSTDGIDAKTVGKWFHSVDDLYVKESRGMALEGFQLQTYDLFVNK